MISALKERTSGAAGVDPARSARLLRLATTASVFTALLLIVVKLGGWLASGSVSLLASLIDSLMDAAASIMNLIAVRYSLAPPDNEHRFGHGKAQALAGLGQAMFVAGSAAFLILHAVDRILNPQALANLGWGITVILFATVATSLLLLVQRYVVVRTGSLAIRADSLHYLTDLLTNLVILIALVLAAFGWPGVDPYFGLAVACFILWSAWKIVHGALQELMDRELPDDVKKQIRDIASLDSRVLGIHELRTRASGQIYIVQMHLELDPKMTLAEAHAIADAAEARIAAAFPGSDVIIHQDPANSAAAPGPRP